MDPAPDHMFPKLRLKYRPNLISLAGGMAALPVTDPAARATPVAPTEWAAMLAAEAPPVVLDVRNSYEWDAGHFEGAERPLEVRRASKGREQGERAGEEGGGGAWAESRRGRRSAYLAVSAVLLPIA